MDALNICLVGHRGVGKTTFLSFVRDRPTVDLDGEIERTSGQTIARIFTEHGETYFRDLERCCLAATLARPGPKVIALGAGFLGPRPDARVVWLRRETDRAGRIFLDRPRLDANVTPLEEYAARFKEREARFRAWADQIITLPEGYAGGLEDLLGDAWTIPFDVTLRPEYRPRVRVRRLEVRDDLTPSVRSGELGSPRLTSYRTPGVTPPPTAAGEEDWALELGDPPRDFAITSAHAGDVASAISRLSAVRSSVRKLAVEVKTFAELRDGHRWWLADPNGRAFLPRSPDGRWRWYRALFGPRMPLHFVREDEGSAPDQPFLWQTRVQPAFGHRFAAVLGWPVEHSRTPTEQRDFFAARGMPVVAIPVREDEWTEAWPILRELGLTHAAVTAPLKGRAFAACDHPDACARELGAVNTLFVDARGTRGTNTDVTALIELARELGAYQNVWLWGGGGTRGAVRAAWPRVREISARAGVTNDLATPDLVIWAVGRARGPALPPPGVRPHLILDLNYADDSPGLEWAQRDGIAYRSGLGMFLAQARGQREFWESLEREGARARESVW